MKEVKWICGEPLIWRQGNWGDRYVPVTPAGVTDPSGKAKEDKDYTKIAAKDFSLYAKTTVSKDSPESQ